MATVPVRRALALLAVLGLVCGVQVTSGGYAGAAAEDPLELTRFGGHLILDVCPGEEARMGRPSKYPEEFRREAVELYRSSDRPRCQVAKSLGISDGSLAAWVKEIDAADEPGALDADERAELARLRKENADLRMDREILRKAAAYFARETIR